MNPDEIFGRFASKYYVGNKQGQPRAGGLENLNRPQIESLGYNWEEEEKRRKQERLRQIIEENNKVISEQRGKANEINSGVSARGYDAIAKTITKDLPSVGAGIIEGIDSIAKGGNNFLSSITKPFGVPQNEFKGITDIPQVKEFVKNSDPTIRAGAKLGTEMMPYLATGRAVNTVPTVSKSLAEFGAKAGLNIAPDMIYGQTIYNPERGSRLEQAGYDVLGGAGVAGLSTAATALKRAKEAKNLPFNLNLQKTTLQNLDNTINNDKLTQELIKMGVKPDDVSKLGADEAKSVLDQFRRNKPLTTPTELESKQFDFIKNSGRTVDDIELEFKGKYDSLLNEQVDYLKSSGKQGVNQGGLMRDAEGEVISRFGRTSNNPQWYRDFFSENGRTPNKKELKEIAIKQLREGDKEFPANPEFLSIENAINNIAKFKQKYPTLDVSADNLADVVKQNNIKKTIDIVSEKSKKSYQKSILKNIEPTPNLKPEEDWDAPVYTNNAWAKAVSNVTSKVSKKADKTPIVKNLTPKEGRPEEYYGLLKERYYQTRGQLDNQKLKYIKPIEKLTQPEKIEVGEMVRKIKPVTEKYQGLVKGIDTEIARWGKELVDLENEYIKKGWIAPEKRILDEDTFKSNVGQYLRDFYRKDKKQAFPLVDKPIKLETGIGKKKLTLEDWGKKAIEFGGGNPADKSLDELKAIGLQAKKDYGWVEEGDIGLERTFKDLVNTVNNYKFFGEITKNKDWWGVNEKAGMVKLPADKRLGPLSEKYVIPEIGEDLKSMVQEKNFIEKYFSPINGWWKIGKTAGSPGTAARNFYSGTLFQNDMAGAPIWRNPKIYGNSVKDYFKKSGRFEEATKSGLFGGDYFSAEIDDVILQKITKDENPTKAFFDELGSKAKDAASYYQRIDHLNRFYLFNFAREKGATAIQARNYANKWQLDYQFVPKVVDTMRKYPLLSPFISFQYLITPRVLEYAAKRPWSFAKYPLILGGLSILAGRQLGMSDEEVKTQKPKDVSWGQLLPWRDQNNKPQWLDLTYMMPFDTATSPKKTLENLIGGGPAGIALNAIRNYDPYFKAPIARNEGEGGKIAEYLARGLLPGVAYNVPVGIGKSFKDSSTKTPSQAVMQQILGIRTASPSKYTLYDDIKEAGTSLPKEHSQDLENLLKSKEQRGDVSNNWLAQQLVTKVKTEDTPDDKKKAAEKLLKGFGITPDKYDSILKARDQRIKDSRKRDK